MTREHVKGSLRGVALVITACMALTGYAGATTLEDIRQRGVVQCGVNTGLPGFSQRDSAGQWHGLDVDVCRAVAAAVFGDAGKVHYFPLTMESRLEALRSGKIDLLANNTTWTMTRDTSLGLGFTGINYYDGQGFMTNKKLGLRSTLELDDATICVVKGTTSILNLKDYFSMHRMGYRHVPCQTPQSSLEAYEAGQCSVITSDQSQLYALRSQMKEPETSVVLPEVISKEPLGPVVRDGDQAWFDIVRWSLFIMINAEELGVSSLNVDRVRKNASRPDIRRLLGLEGECGEKMGLSRDWSYNIIKQVGNYGESFDRNVGLQSPLKIKRGLNALWRDGGLLYAPPVR